MLAHSSPDIKERALAAPLTVYTSGTPATPARLRSLLVDVRLRGFAYCPGFGHEEALGIAAPVRAGKGEVIAALSVIVPNEAGPSSPSYGPRRTDSPAHSAADSTPTAAQEFPSRLVRSTSRPTPTPTHPSCIPQVRWSIWRATTSMPWPATPRCTPRRSTGRTSGPGRVWAWPTSATRSPGGCPACCWTPTRPDRTRRAESCARYSPRLPCAGSARSGTRSPRTSSTPYWPRVHVSTPSPRSPRRSPCGSSPTRSASAPKTGTICCPTATSPSTPSARATTWY
ncbi:IclR family transcriptional regulator domain-containing protein [Streptomyces sp. NPDC002514]